MRSLLNALGLPALVVLAMSVLGVIVDRNHPSAAAAAGFAIALPLALVGLASLGDIVVRGTMNRLDRTRLCLRAQVLALLVFALTFVIASLNFEHGNHTTQFEIGVAMGALISMAFTCALVLRQEMLLARPAQPAELADDPR
jgi:hypothetical protein